MLNTHAIARSLTDAEFTQAQADAITNVVRLAAEHCDHVTSDQVHGRPPLVVRINDFIEATVS